MDHSLQIVSIVSNSLVIDSRSSALDRLKCCCFLLDVSRLGMRARFRHVILKKEHVTGQWQTTNSLAMSTANC
jgi:hypothetical protein